MATKCDVATGKFVIPRLAEFFHLFPHLDFNFDNTTTYFIPTDQAYQQVLLLYSGAFAVFGGLLFLVTSVYFLIWFYSNNCQSKKQVKPSSKCWMVLLVWLIYAAVLICSGSVIAAFVFNSEVNDAVKEVTTSIANINNTLLDVQDEVTDIREYLLDAEDTITDLEQRYPELPKPVLMYLDLLNREFRNVVSSLRPVKKVSLPEINDYINTGECYRWWITIGLLSLQSLLCVLSFCGTICKSKLAYVFVIVLATVCVLLTWTSCGVDLAVAVAAADLCLTPEATINFYVRKSVPKAFINYYIKCQPGSQNPYQKYVDNASRHLAECLRLVNWTLEQPLPLAARNDLLSLKSNIGKTENQLAAINKALNCTYANQQYTQARCAICYAFETGISNLLLSGLIVGVVLVMILCCVSSVWESFGYWKRRKDCSFSHKRDRSRMDEGTPYQSISDSNINNQQASTSESAPLIPSIPPPGYDAVGPRGDLQFHSCEEGRQDRNGVNIITPLQPSAPPLPLAEAFNNQTTPRSRKKQPHHLNGPMSMAF